MEVSIYCDFIVFPRHLRSLSLPVPCFKYRRAQLPLYDLMASASQGKFKTREDFKKEKELEEARKAGTALPAVDEQGNDINPHIPEYISQAPWYLKYDGPTLQHQRNLLEQRRNYDGLETWYPRGKEAKAKEAPTKFRHGACTNCGALTHVARNCFELKRKVGAKWTGKHLKADDVVKEVNLGWEAKRDRWNGYNPDDYRHVVSRYNAIDEEREKVRAELGAEKKADEEANDAGAVVTTGGAGGERVVVKNLRIREDTAKYLYNLDVNSAYYDPKTRSMRADPTPHIDLKDKDFAGDNFERNSGDVGLIAAQQLHAFEASEAGRMVPHMQAEPTRAEATFKEFERKKKTLNEERQSLILKQYGGAEYFEKPKALIEAERRAAEKADAEDESSSSDEDDEVSKETRRPVGEFPEDVLERNHTAIWGSYYKDDRWGYACCHQMTRNSYCTGEAGKTAARKVAENMEKRMKDVLKNEKKRMKEHEEAARKRKRTNEGPSNAPEDVSEERKSRRKVEEELRAQKEEENSFEPDDRKRGYNTRLGSSRAGESDGFNVSEEAMEAYRIRRHVSEDPMANYLKEKEGKEE